jgi:hypothetical protein
MARYSITKDPFLRYYRTNGSYPAVSMVLFAGHIVDQRKEKLISQMHFGFSVISFGLIDMAGGRAGLLATNDFIFYLLLSFS